MSTRQAAKGNKLKGQTVMGDFFSKSSNQIKSPKSSGKGKVPEAEFTSGTKSKVGQSKQDKKSSTGCKKGEKTVEKKTDLQVEKKASTENRPSLKRKVTGAGMFAFSWTRGAQKDTEQYRNGYPDKEDDLELNDNYRFYTNQIPSKPDGDYIDDIHVKWWGDYKLLEIHHGYIQWLFPIRESGLNWHAQELQLHEIKKIQKKKKAMQRILTSYKMMLNFYGMELENEEDGTIVRGENWKERFRHLNRSYHNYLRITRILKCLGEFGYEHLKKNFVKFILHEGLVEGTLSNVIESCVKYWIGVLKDDDEREEVFDYYEKLQDDNLNNKRRNRSPSPPGSYRPNLIENSKLDEKKEKDKKVAGVKGKKDEVDGDIENELSDDEDGTLNYAMSLIEEDLPKKKYHELSESEEENIEHPEESQEMAHWNAEAKKSNNDELEACSECDDSVPEKMATDNINFVNKEDTKEQFPNDVVEQNAEDLAKSEVEKKEKDNIDIVSNEKEEKTEDADKNSNENSNLKTEKENDEPENWNNEKMDTTETVNDTHSNSNVTYSEQEEKSIASIENNSSNSGNEVEKQGEEKSKEFVENNTTKPSNEVEKQEEECMET